VRTGFLLRLLGIAALLIFAVLVWPTYYRHDHIDMGAGRSFPVREDRFTGRTEILYPDGWRHPKNRDQILPANQLAEVQIRPSLARGESTGAAIAYSGVSVHAYNGYRFTLKELTLEVTVKHRDASGGSRRYRTDAGTIGVEPFHVGSFSADLGDDFLIFDGDSWTCRLVEAKGDTD